MDALAFFFRSMIPDLPPINARELARSMLGACLGLAATAWISRVANGHELLLPVLIAPMGASAVLLFAAPASPLAQPWSILGGNLVAAVVGVATAATISNLPAAAALAVALSIGIMALLRCLHPPSGAVALTAVLGGPAIRDLGYGFVLWPVEINSLILLTAALVFNNSTGRRYPHRAPGPTRDRARDGGRSSSDGTASDIDTLLEGYGPLEIGRADLEAILRRSQILAYGRRARQTVCSDIMSRDVVAIAPGAPLREALQLLRRHRVKAVPVTDEHAGVVGIVTQTDILENAEWSGTGPSLGLARRLRLTLHRGRAPSGRVEDIMTTSPKTVRADTPIADVVPWMLEAGLYHLPVLGRNDKLVGIVSQTDLVSTLLRDAAAA